MLSLISPAKKLAQASQIPPQQTSTILFEKQSTILVKILKTMTVADIATLMGLSEKLAQLNFERYQDFNFKGSKRQPSHPALYLFQGDVYQALDANNLSKKAISFSQDHLMILSGLYGLLRPLDLIQPYRLEMGTKLENPKGKDLYALWQQTVTEQLNKTLSHHKNPFILNLASTEYSKAISVKALKYPMINVNFKENKSGKLKTIGILAKKARGTMARYILENQFDTIDKIKSFDELGYQYTDTLSDQKNLMFIRNAP